MSATFNPRILVFAGSIRRGSHNQHLARLAAQAYGEDGNLEEEVMCQRLDSHCQRLVSALGRLNAPDRESP